MIYECLSCLAEEMNVYFKSRLKLHEDKVLISAIVNQDGSIAIQGENKILITLINVIRDVNMKKEMLSSAAISGNAARPVCLQLYVMVSCYFSAGNYAEALRFLSFAISFLQQKNVFDHNNTPKLDEAIDKLVFELESFEPERQSNIWSTLGAKYMPSVFYKVRMIIYNSDQVKEYRPLVSGISADNR